MRKDILEQKQLILDMIAKNAPKQQICNVLNCKHDTLNRYMKKMGIEYAGNQSSKGISQPQRRTHASEYLYNGSTVQSHKLKLVLIRDGYFEHKCSGCHNTEWMGQPIPLELDHIDGQHFNNELSNLRLLCPNCHAQTPTYRAKNKRTVREKSEVDKILNNLEETHNLSIKEEKIVKPKTVNICKTCETPYEKCGNERGKYFCSDYCYRKSTEKFDITPEELSKLVWEMPTTNIAEMYNVSDNAIAKRCKKYNIEKPPRGYWMKNKG